MHSRLSSLRSGSMPRQGTPYNTSHQGTCRSTPLLLGGREPGTSTLRRHPRHSFQHRNAPFCHKSKTGKSFSCVYAHRDQCKHRDLRDTIVRITSHHKHSFVPNSRHPFKTVVSTLRATIVFDCFSTTINYSGPPTLWFVFRLKMQIRPGIKRTRGCPLPELPCL